MFHPMALTVMLALGGSLVLALTLMPALCSFLLGGRIAERDNLIIRFIKRVYFPTLRWSLRLRWLVVLGAIALFALAILIFRHLGADFIPKLDEGTFTIMVFRTSSMNITQSVAEQRKTEEEIRKRVPEITHVFSESAARKLRLTRCRRVTAIFTSTTNRKMNGERSAIGQSARRNLRESSPLKLKR